MGTKRSVLTDEKGLPLSVVLSGANTHDIKLLEETLDKIVISRPAVCESHPQNLCLDAGYTGSAQSVKTRQYIAHIRPRGEERKEIERNPDFKARHWVAEVTHLPLQVAVRPVCLPDLRHGCRHHARLRRCFPRPHGQRRPSECSQ